MRLERPDLQVRRRVPFRAIRKYSLAVVLVVMASRARARCIPDPRPDPRPAAINHRRAVNLVVEAVTRVRR